MFDRESTLLRYMVGYLKALLRDWPDEQLLTPITGAANPPAFTVGHLAMSLDLALQLLGQPTQCPASWHTAFGPEADPKNVVLPYPSKSEFLARIESGLEAVVIAAKSADAAAMAGPQQFKFFVGTPIQTVGDCVALLMTTHFSIHVGQLSVMRRVCGKPPLF